MLLSLSAQSIAAASSGRSVGGETRIHPGEHPACPVQPPESGHFARSPPPVPPGSPFVPEFPAPAHRARGRIRSVRTRPPGHSAAQASVEAKMRSGRGEKSQPESPRRPSMRIDEAPRPRYARRTGSEKRQGQRSLRSRAAPRRMVLPLAQAAASRNVSVAPTLGKRAGW